MANRLNTRAVHVVYAAIDQLRQVVGDCDAQDFGRGGVVAVRNVDGDQRQLLVGQLTERFAQDVAGACLLYTSPSPRDRTRSRMPSSA